MLNSRPQITPLVSSELHTHSSSRPTRLLRTMNSHRRRSTDDYLAGSHRSENTTAPCAPNRPRSPPVLVRTDTYPRYGSPMVPPLSGVASFRKTQSMDLEQGSRRRSVPNGLMEGRHPSCSEPSTSVSSTPPRSPRHTLADVRLAARAQKAEKIAVARAIMKQRFANYCSRCEQQLAQAEHQRTLSGESSVSEDAVA